MQTARISTKPYRQQDKITFAAQAVWQLMDSIALYTGLLVQAI